MLNTEITSDALIMRERERKKVRVFAPQVVKEVARTSNQRTYYARV